MEDEFAQTKANLEAIRAAGVVICKRSDFKLVRDDRLPTSSVNVFSKIITISDKMIPKGLPQWKAERLLDATAFHEYQHVLSLTIGKLMLAWLEQVKANNAFYNIASSLGNLFLDIRADNQLILRHRMDFGIRRKEFLDICGTALVNSTRATSIHGHRPELALEVLALKTKWNIDVIDELLDNYAAKIVKEAADEFTRAMWVMVDTECVRTVRRVYDLFLKLTVRPPEEGLKLPRKGEKEEEPGEKGGESTPVDEDSTPEDEEEGPAPDGDSAAEEEDSTEEEEPRDGGDGEEESTEEEGEPWDGGSWENYGRDIDPDEIPNIINGLKQLNATIEQIEQANEELAKLIEEERKKAEEEAKEIEGLAAVSLGTGLEIPPLPGDMYSYVKLAEENSPHIVKLLNLLKKLQHLEMKRTPWTRAGRYMTEYHAIIKTMSRAMGKPFDRPFEHREVREAELRTKLCLLVDFSGSVPTREAQNALTIIAEAAGRWLPSEDMAIVVFGTEFMRIKAFIEPWHNTKSRIGTTYNMYCTAVAAPFEACIRMLGAFRTDVRAMVLVSDFQFDEGDGEQLLKHIHNANIGGINVVGVALGSSSLKGAQEYIKDSTYITNIEELPDRFFEVYRKAATGKLHV